MKEYVFDIKREDIFIGARFQTIYGNPYEILKIVDNLHYIIKFLKTDNIIQVDIYRMKVGNIRDSFAPSVKGVGYTGTQKCVNEDKLKYHEYDIWKHVLDRCYNPKCNAYSRYGGKGVQVCYRWHNFTNFFNDVKYIPGYNKELFESGKLHLDKDILQINIPHCFRVYSPLTCVFIPQYINGYYKDADCAAIYGIAAINMETNEQFDFESITDARKVLHMDCDTIKNKMYNNQYHAGYKFIPKPYFRIPEYVIEAENRNVLNPIHDEEGLRIVYRRVDNGSGFCTN